MRKKYFLRRFFALALSALLLLSATPGFAAEVSPAPASDTAVSTPSDEESTSGTEASPSAEPTIESSSEPTDESAPTAEPTAESAPMAEPSAQISAEAMAGPTLEPAAEPTPEETEALALLDSASQDDTRPFVVTDEDGNEIESGADYTYSNFTLNITGSGTYRISMRDGMEAGAYRIMVSSINGCTVILNSVRVDMSPYLNQPAMQIAQPANAVTLRLEGESLLKSGANCAALQKENGSALTITGDGSLTAVGGQYAAGIGGGFGGSASNIEIAGGTITAVGGDEGAGIGGGSHGDSSDITISGGTVTATGGSGVGSGSNNVIVLQDKQQCLYTRGSNAESATTTRIKTAGSTALETDAYLHLVFGALTPDLNIEAGGGGGLTDSDYTYTDGVLTITGSNTYKISMAEGVTTTTERLVVTSGCTVILNNVQITAKGLWNSGMAISSTSDVLLQLEGENSFAGGNGAAGIRKENSGKLTITGSGSLTAQGGNNGAGIGGNMYNDTSNITITGGTITAISGGGAAGIGGGSGIGGSVGNASNITISGGNVTAAGSTGIGGAIRCGLGYHHYRRHGYSKRGGYRDRQRLRRGEPRQQQYPYAAKRRAMRVYAWQQRGRRCIRKN